MLKFDLKFKNDTFRWLLVTFAVCFLVFLYRYKLGSTGLTSPKLNRVNLTDNELVITIDKMRLRHSLEEYMPTRKANEHQLKLLTLGNRLFFDEDFSANQKISCGTCHQPHASFTDNKPVAVGLETTSMNTPTLINSIAGQWFFWNGRSDSLASQALGPVENQKEHGFTRTKVAQVIIKKYKVMYEELFGKIPEGIMQQTVEGQSVHPNSNDSIHNSNKQAVSSEVAAYALATLASDKLVKQILKDSQSKGKQPVEIIKSMSLGELSPQSDFDALNADQKKSVNTIFANFGRAIAAFEESIRTEDSAFDLFAHRYLEKNKTALQQSGQTSDNGTNKNFVAIVAESPLGSLSENFGESELNGLRLFTGRGNCTLCHQGQYFTDQQFHNIGLMSLSDSNLDLGRAQGMLLARASEFNCRGSYLAPTRDESISESCLELPFLESESSELVGAFKTPTLRNLVDTAPYGHDGRFPKLENILHHYNQLGVPPAVGHTEESLIPLNFSPSELKDLEAFLKSLNSTVSYFKEDHR